MGGGNPVQQISEAVQSVVAPVIAPVAAVVAPVAAPIVNSDIGKAIGTLGTDAGNVLATPYVTASDLARGDVKQAAKSVGRGASSFTDFSYMGAPRFIGEDRLAQGILRSDKLDKSTFGLSSDFAGTTSGLSTSRSSGEVSSADLNSFGRFESKIGGTALAYSAYRGYQGLDSVTKAGYKESALLTSSGIGAAKAASKGDLGGVINEIGGTKIGDTVNTYLPGIPDVPSLPSWVPDLSSLYDSVIPTASSGAPGAGSFTPFNQSGATSSDAPPLIQSPEAKTIAVGGAVLVLAFLILKKGRK